MNIIGAGGHAKVIIDALLATGETVDHIYDQNPNVTSLMGRKVETLVPELSLAAGLYVIGIGLNRIRREKATQYALPYGQVIHPTALLGSEVSLGEGTVILHRAIVQAASWIGHHVIVNTNAQVDHDCFIGDYSHIGPGAILCGGVQVGKEVLIGAGAIVLPGTRIEDRAVIGAGAVVTRLVKENQIVKGNPAK